MPNRFSSYISKISQFMYGRNGFDKYSGFLILISLLANGANSLIWAKIPSIVLYAVSALFFIYAVFRILSKNIVKRQNENSGFSRLLKTMNINETFYKIKNKSKELNLRVRFAGTHRFRRCRNCGELLRLSKKRGPREITCPKCRSRQKFKIWL